MKLIRPYHFNRVSLLSTPLCIIILTKRWAKKCPDKSAPDPPCDPRPTPYPAPSLLEPCLKRPKVLIVGAGLAGLSAANRLTQAGFSDFTIIEATDRPGGRIHSCWMGNEVGELGAMWITGANAANPVFSLGAQEGLLKDPMAWRVKPPTFKIPHLTSEGRFIEPHITVPAGKLFSKIKQQAFSLFSRGSGKEHGSLMDFLKVRINEELKNVPKDWICDILRVFWCLTNSMKNRFGADINQLSSNLYGSSVVLPGKTLRVPLGLVGILGPLLKNIPTECLRYCSPVERVVWGEGCDSRVSLHLKNGDIIKGDFVILTVSLGVLKFYAEKWFLPSLPDWKKRAIWKLGYGKMTRIVMEYDQPFWVPGEGMMRFCWTSKELSVKNSWRKGLSLIEDLPGAKKKLMTTIGGEEAPMVESCSEEDIAEEMTRMMRTFSGNPTLPFPTALSRSEWNCSPWTQGGTSYMAEASTLEDVSHLGAPLPGAECPGAPVVLFAGEATAPGHLSTLLGAHLSGVREADRIIALTKKYQGPPPIDRYAP